MKNYMLSLDQCAQADRDLVGQKALILGELIEAGFAVPPGICITTEYYREYIQATGIKDHIFLELGRKRYRDMRWEEHWDASLRIRHLFLQNPLPEYQAAEIKTRIEERFHGEPIALRSSAPAEDQPEASFAGLYASYLNLKSWDEISRHIRLVWASLWSDASLLYQTELKLDVEQSAMAVIVQSMIAGEKAGVAFSLNPVNPEESVIEAVYGLNQGLVDGDIDPDRWTLDRKTGHTLTVHQADHLSQMIPLNMGVGLQDIPQARAANPVLTDQEVTKVFQTLNHVEELFQSPQDMEWTLSGTTLYVLQARPITTVPKPQKQDRKAFDLSLRRSFESLKKLGKRIEKELLPGLLKDAASLSQRKLQDLSDKELAAEIQSRRGCYEKWKTVYWEDFIPFAHGMRLFGQIYNERVQPSDPYEFLELVATSDLESVRRNRELEELAREMKPFLEQEKPEQGMKDRMWQAKIDGFLERHNHVACRLQECREERKALWNLLRELAQASPSEPKTDLFRRERLLQDYFSAFAEEEREYAQSLIELGRKSYKLRDDDNIYLGRIEALLHAGLKEARSRTPHLEPEHVLHGNIEEALRALKRDPLDLQKVQSPEEAGAEMTFSARQLRGQPAGPGIARGPGRVITQTSDLFSFKKGEILVCDAVDPNMTFAIPLSAAIVERRGGMLIHGAIIAREYGIPCVTGVPRATEFIKTGDQLTVDGYYGLVIIHSEDGEIDKS